MDAAATFGQSQSTAATARMSSVKSISIMNPSDKRLVSLSSSALAENLLHTFTSKGATPDADILDRWLQEIRLEIRRRRRGEISSSSAATTTAEGRDDTTLGPAVVEEEDLLRAVREAALQQWHEQTSSSLPPLKDPKKSSSSVSIFLSQLNAGGGALASFVTWDRIQEQTAGNEQQQLQMLLGVQHLQDVLPDWAQHIRPFLCRGLTDASSSGHTNDYLKVHQEWFQKSRSSTEYRSLQIDLCENVLDSIHHQSDGSLQQQQQLQSKISLALDMFTDWMLRGLYVHDERVRKIGFALWTLMTDKDIGMMTMMIQADPDAMWFSAWNAHQSPEQCLQIVQQQTAEKDKANLLSSALQDFTQTDHDIVNTKYRHYWLAVIRSILVTTRVARFPWALLQKKDPQGFVLDLYLQEYVRQSSPSSNTKTVVYNDAIETLLCGCRTAVAKDVFQEMLDKVKDFSKANNDLLVNILTRVERT